MKHPEIFFRTSEFEKIKSDYYEQKQSIDSEVENYFADTNSMEDLYFKVNGLENSKEILDLFPINMIELKQNPIATEYNRVITSDPFSYSSLRSYNIEDSNSAFNISLVILLLFLFTLIKKWRAKKIFGFLLLFCIGWNLYNYYVKEPEFLAQSSHFINVNKYRNDKMHEKANEKLAQLYQPSYTNNSITTYEYEVEGTDNYGDSVEGYVETSGKYGTGYLIDQYSDKKNIEVEWVSNGVLLGSDNDGNEYELQVKH
tara:strand:+ start:544 stop:1314 length:771 start_codon:yes stop_codon:yes gene_type:complete